MENAKQNSVEDDISKITVVAQLRSIVAKLHNAKDMILEAKKNMIPVQKNALNEVELNLKIAIVAYNESLLYAKELYSKDEAASENGAIRLPIKAICHNCMENMKKHLKTDTVAVKKPAASKSIAKMCEPLPVVIISRVKESTPKSVSKHVRLPPNKLKRTFNTDKSQAFNGKVNDPKRVRLAITATVKQKVCNDNGKNLDQKLLESQANTKIQPTHYYLLDNIKREHSYALPKTNENGSLKNEPTIRTIPKTTKKSICGKNSIQMNHPKVSAKNAQPPISASESMETNLVVCNSNQHISEILLVGKKLYDNFIENQPILDTPSALNDSDDDTHTEVMNQPITKTESFQMNQVSSTSNVSDTKSIKMSVSNRTNSDTANESIEMNQLIAISTATESFQMNQVSSSSEMSHHISNSHTEPSSNSYISETFPNSNNVATESIKVNQSICKSSPKTLTEILNRYISESEWFDMKRAVSSTPEKVMNQPNSETNKLNSSDSFGMNELIKFRGNRPNAECDSNEMDQLVPKLLAPELNQDFSDIESNAMIQLISNATFKWSPSMKSDKITSKTNLIKIEVDQPICNHRIWIAEPVKVNQLTSNTVNQTITVTKPTKRDMDQNFSNLDNMLDRSISDSFPHLPERMIHFDLNPYEEQWNWHLDNNLNEPKIRFYGDEGKGGSSLLRSCGHDSVKTCLKCVENFISAFDTDADA